MPRRKSLIFGFLAIFILAIFLLAGFMRSNYVAPILMYHSVSPTVDADDRLAVSVSTFNRQMRFLKANHYNVMPLEELAAMIKKKIKLPPRAVALTFDDGFKDNYTYAFPILKEYGLPATVFIIINEVARPEGDRLSWENILTMQDSGLISFGSHTLSHPFLTLVNSEAVLRSQIFDSKKILEEKLGRQINGFSYPAGRFNAHIRDLVKEAGYKFAVATNPGKHYPNDDAFGLKRLRISENSSNLFVFAVESSGFYTFLKESKRKYNGKE